MFSTASAGLAHTLLLAAAIFSDDARRLSDDKLLDTTQWRGLIIEEPASQLTPHASRRALDRTSVRAGSRRGGLPEDG